MSKMITPKNLPRHELIGLDVQVVESENSDEEGLDGKVIDETKSTIKIGSNDEEKTLKKQGRTLRFELPSGKKVEVEGNILEGRPEDRIKKRLKKW